MSYTTERNETLTHRFSQLYPGAHSTSTPPAKTRIFQSRAQGSRFWDVDNNEYVDYTGGLGTNILGHRHPEYIDALKTFMDDKSFCTGGSFLFSEADILLAEKLVKHVPCAEQIKLCVSGSEACQQALRLARAYTGRPYYVKFGGHYHGWIDNIYGGISNPHPDGKPFPLYKDKSDTLGRSPGSGCEGLMLPWGDIDILEQTLNSYGDEIAVIMMEAVCEGATMLPPAGYLEKVRALCDKHSIVMCMDEVITGFRVGLQGAQGFLNVTPDLCVLGKAFGGGLPISAVAGRKDILEQYRGGKVKGPGTFNGNPLCVQAAVTTISILERDGGALYKEMDRVQTLLMQGLDEIARRHNVPLRVQGPLGTFATYFGVDPDTALYTSEDEEKVDYDLIHKVHKSLWKEGVSSLLCRWYPSVVHTEVDNQRALEGFERVIKSL